MKRLLEKLTHHPADAGMLANLLLAILATALLVAVVYAASGGGK